MQSMKFLYLITGDGCMEKKSCLKTQVLYAVTSLYSVIFNNILLDKVVAVICKT